MNTGKTSQSLANSVVARLRFDKSLNMRTLFVVKARVRTRGTESGTQLIDDGLLSISRRPL